MSPGRIPAAEAGESAATFQASTPFNSSDQATPSSTMSYRERCTKFSQAKTMAASVANASTTAPTRTRRFCRITRLKSSHLTLTQFQQLVFHSLVDSDRHKTMQTNYLNTSRGRTRSHILFLVGRIRNSIDLQITKTEDLLHPGNCETRVPTEVDHHGYSRRSNPGLEGCRIPRWLPNARTAAVAEAVGYPHSGTDSPDRRPRHRGPP